MTTVSENHEGIGVCQKLLVEIEYVPVRVALTQNGNETKNEPLHGKGFAVGRDQTLGGKLRGAVKRSLHGEGR